jgi:hypothetical protein
MNMSEIVKHPGRKMLLATLAIAVLAGCVPSASEVSKPIITLTSSQNAANLNSAHDLEMAAGTFKGTLSEPVFGAMTREDIFWRLGNVSTYSAWQKNQSLIAELTNQYGQKITFGTDEEGEVKLTIDAQNSERVQYPQFDGGHSIFEFDEKYVGIDQRFQGQGVKNYLIIYGNSDVLSGFKNESFKQAAELFLKEYFISTSSPNRVLHLVIAKNNAQIDFVDVLNSGHNPKPNSLVDNLGQSVYSGVANGQNFALRADVVLSLETIHDNSLKYGIPLDKTLTHVLANEIIDLEIRRVTGNIDGSKGKQPEAPGTIESYAAVYDSDLASTILGGKSYLPFVNFLTSEMRNVATIKK